MFVEIQMRLDIAVLAFFLPLVRPQRTQAGHCTQPLERPIDVTFARSVDATFCQIVVHGVCKAKLELFWRVTILEDVRSFLRFILLCSHKADG